MWPGRLQNQQGEKKLWLTKLSSLFIVMPTCFFVNTICEYTVSLSNKHKSCLSSLHCHSSFILNYLKPNLLYESFFFFFTASTINLSKSVIKMQLVSLSHIYEDILPPCGHLKTPHNFGVFTN